MTFPKTDGSEWGAAQSAPWVPHNESMRRLDAAVSRWIVADRDLTAPPGSCVDGANYLVASSPTGAWAGQAGKLATAVGTNAANGWLFTFVAVEGNQLYLQDEGVEIEHDGSVWVNSGTNVSAPITDATTARTASLGDLGQYIIFTNGSAVTFTIPPNSSVAFPVGSTISFEQNGAGTVTIDPDTGVTLNSRGGFLASSGQFAVVQVKKVATDTWTVIGDVA